MNLKMMMAAAAAAAVVGCVSSGTKVSQGEIDAFQVGRTTESQVVHTLGEPNATATATDGSKIDVYAHTAAHATAASYVPVVGLFAGGAKGNTSSVTFAFDTHGVLKSVSQAASQTSINTGLANQQ